MQATPEMQATPAMKIEGTDELYRCDSCGATHTQAQYELNECVCPACNLVLNSIHSVQLDATEAVSVKDSGPVSVSSAESSGVKLPQPKIACTLDTLTSDLKKDLDDVGSPSAARAAGHPR